MQLFAVLPLRLGIIWRSLVGRLRECGRWPIRRMAMAVKARALTKSNEARWLITAIGPCAMREETLQRLAELHPLTVRPGDHQITHAVGTAGLQRRPFNHRIPQLRQPTLRGRQIDDPQSDMVDTIGVGGRVSPSSGSWYNSSVSSPNCKTVRRRGRRAPTFAGVRNRASDRSRRLVRYRRSADRRASIR